MTIVSENFLVTGMHCAACANSVESILASTKGVQAARVNYAASSVWVEYDEALSIKDLSKAVQSVGYGLKEDKEEEEVPDRTPLYKLLLAMVCSTPVMIIGMFFHQWSIGPMISLFLSLPVIVWSGADFFKNAWKQALLLRSNMDTLIAIGTGTAFVFSTINTIFPHYFHSKGLHAHVYFESAVVVITLILLGKFLEEKAKRETGEAIRKLAGLQAKAARVLRDQVEKIVPISDIALKELCLVYSGEKIPVDGILTSDFGLIDESMINGEPYPVQKAKGDYVYAGTIVLQEKIILQSEKIGKETLLAQIIRQVKEAQGSKAPIQKVADKISAIFVPAVLIIALLTYLGWIVYDPETALTHALISTINVLVVACPCALGLATPTALIAGMGNAASHGILIRNAEALEKMKDIRKLVFDKTGTLTKGKPEVKDIYVNKTVDSSQIVSIWNNLELQSGHPLGIAISAYLQSTQPQQKKIELHATIIPGKGVQSEYQNNTYWVGNEKWFDELSCTLDTDAKHFLEKCIEKKQTPVLFGSKNTGVLAIAALQDCIKDEALGIIRNLKNTGIDPVLLSGDRQETVAAVAKELHIDTYQGSMLPSDKADYIKKLQQEGFVTGMAGDGINDAPALATADVGIAMATGTDIAMNAAKVTLLKGDLTKIIYLRKIATKTSAVIRQNLFWAFIYNIAMIPLAMGIFYPTFKIMLDPMIAGGAMALSSITVLLNSLRLK